MDHDDEVGFGTRSAFTGGGSASVGTAEADAESELLMDRRIEENKREMTPEMRDLFERICSLQNEIGPGEFDINEAIRELRNDA